MGELPLLQQAQEKYSAQGLALVAVDCGEQAPTVQSIVNSKALTFQVLLDPGNKVIGQYAVRGIPTTFFIDKTGQITDIQVGAFSSLAQIEGYLAKILK